MTMSAKLRREILRRCCDALVGKGFVRYRDTNVDFPLTRNVQCWVGLNTRLTSEYIDVNPFVGVHFVDIEKMWTALKIGKYNTKYNRSYATYSVHFGTLLPQEPIFRFTQSTNIFSEAERLAKMYSKAGVDFSRSISSYEALIPYLVERSSALGGYPERAASCLYIMGNFRKAFELTIKFQKSDPDYFEGFALPFLQLSELNNFTR